MNMELIRAEREKVRALLDELTNLGTQRQHMLDRLWTFEERGKMVRQELDAVYNRIDDLIKE